MREYIQTISTDKSRVSFILENLTGDAKAEIRFRNLTDPFKILNVLKFVKQIYHKINNNMSTIKITSVINIIIISPQTGNYTKDSIVNICDMT